ncbi:C-_U-editing enzyme APOBEC-1, partial [Galemys pyrenaicus]
MASAAGNAGAAPAPQCAPRGAAPREAPGPPVTSFLDESLRPPRLPRLLMSTRSPSSRTGQRFCACRKPSQSRLRAGLLQQRGPVSTPLGSDRDRGLRRVRAAERLRGKVQLAVRARAHAPSADETQAPWAAEVPTRDEDMGAGLALCSCRAPADLPGEAGSAAGLGLSSGTRARERPSGAAPRRANGGLLCFRRRIEPWEFAAFFDPAQLRKETCLLYEVHWGRSRKIWRHSIKNCNRHVEVSFMENFTADSRSARHCTIVWFLSWSPCSECSRAIGEFLRQRPHVRLTVYVARLYHHYAERNRRGLRNLEQSGLHIRVMRAPGETRPGAAPGGSAQCRPSDYQHCWREFANYPPGDEGRCPGFPAELSSLFSLELRCILLVSGRRAQRGTVLGLLLLFPHGPQLPGRQIPACAARPPGCGDARCAWAGCRALRGRHCTQDGGDRGRRCAGRPARGAGPSRAGQTGRAARRPAALHRLRVPGTVTTDNAFLSLSGPPSLFPGLKEVSENTDSVQADPPKLPFRAVPTAHARGRGRGLAFAASVAPP